MDFLKNKLLTIVLVLCLAFTIFIGVTAGRKGNTGGVQEIINSTVAPVEKFVYSAGQRIGNIFYFVKSISTTRKENIKLKSEVDKLNQKVIDYDRYKRENEELARMLEFKNAHPQLKLKGANVVGRVGENWFNMILLDAGEADGIKKGQYVITSQGLVGQVFEANKNTSKVITIIDDKANIPVKISSTGDEGMLKGVGAGIKESQCKINFLPIDTKTAVGDPVVTSNMLSDSETPIPADILVGFIERIDDEKPNLIKAAYVKPVVDFSRIEKVLVIIQ